MVEINTFYPEGHQAHSRPGHPERPERIETIIKALEQAGYWDHFNKRAPLELPAAYLQAVHTSRYLRRLQETGQRGGWLDMDTYTTPDSWDLALKAAGGAAAVTSAVWEAEGQRGFALTRPPGHHVTMNHGMGFCLLNNAAVAADYLIRHGRARRVAIVDLDLHHGNGTQDIFYRRGDVFYLSTHQYPFFPGTGALEETGFGPGEHCNANFPLPAGSGDQAFREVTHSLILPLLDRFQPKILLVSVGFDVHWRDPLGGLLVSAAGYGESIAALTRWADENCKGRIALILEGGYDLEAGAACARTAAAALSDPSDTAGIARQDSLGPSPDEESEDWRAMVDRAKQIWDL